LETVQTPTAGYALEVVLAGALEAQGRADDEVSDGT
jgi:hypothetical protein